MEKKVKYVKNVFATHATENSFSLMFGNALPLGASFMVSFAKILFLAKGLTSTFIY